MKAKLTSKGQITIPLKIRKRLNLKPGDVLDFDEHATILQARRVIDPGEWERSIERARKAWRDPEERDGHRRSATDVIEDTRGPVELPETQK